MLQFILHASFFFSFPKTIKKNTVDIGEKQKKNTHIYLYKYIYIYIYTHTYIYTKQILKKKNTTKHTQPLFE